MSKKILVAYFSASGRTKRVAENLADAVGADLFEIEPVQKYTPGDLNWMDKNSRSTLEMNDPNSRPEIREKVQNFDKFDVIFVGFPIWWYKAPTIINTFLESYDFSNKKIVLFATSGGSGLGSTENILKPLCSKTTIWAGGKILNVSVSKEELKAWVESLNL